MPRNREHDGRVCAGGADVWWFEMMGDSLAVLLYHSIDSTSSDPSAVSWAQFESHLDAIVASGRTPLSIAEVGEWLRGEREINPRSVAITFDNGYRDTFEALQRVAERNLRATLYVTTGAIDTDSGIESEQLRALAERPDVFEIGAHTATNPHLDELGAREAQEEMVISRYALHTLLRRNVTTLAYPHGAYSRATRELAIDAGFTSAVAGKNALSHSEDDPWAIARWSVNADTPAGNIVALLEGYGVPLSRRRESLRTSAFRQWRRAQRRFEVVGGDLIDV